VAVVLKAEGQTYPYHCVSGPMALAIAKQLNVADFKASKLDAISLVVYHLILKKIVQ